MQINYNYFSFEKIDLAMLKNYQDFYLQQNFINFDYSLIEFNVPIF